MAMVYCVGRLVEAVRVIPLKNGGTMVTGRVKDVAGGAIHSIVAFGDVAETLAQFGGAGVLVELAGSLQNRKGSDGKWYTNIRLGYAVPGDQKLRQAATAVEGASPAAEAEEIEDGLPF